LQEVKVIEDIQEVTHSHGDESLTKARLGNGLFMQQTQKLQNTQKLQ
jgi:hypothetical protein